VGCVLTQVRVRGVVVTDQPKAVSLPGLVVKNALALLALAAGVFGLQTGYFSPDRPSRPQWERIEAAKNLASGQLVYTSDFSTEKITADPTSVWGFYNGASPQSVTADKSGIVIGYNNQPWIGARLQAPSLEPGAIYRISVEADAVTEPGALIVRNRQLDLTRQQLPLGKAVTQIHFAAPPGRLDRVILAFIPDGRSRPNGSLKIISVKLERMGN
jgi:hypothetical protein